MSAKIFVGNQVGRAGRISNKMPNFPAGGGEHTRICGFERLTESDLNKSENIFYKKYFKVNISLNLLHRRLEYAKILPYIYGVLLYTPPQVGVCVPESGLISFHRNKLPLVP